MEEKSTATLEKIQEAAMSEFLDKGFQGASLRQIVKNAGVRSGGHKKVIFTFRRNGMASVMPFPVSSARPRG